MLCFSPLHLLTYDIFYAVIDHLLPLDYNLYESTNCVSFVHSYVPSTYNSHRHLTDIFPLLSEQMLSEISLQ